VSGRPSLGPVLRTARLELSPPAATDLVGVHACLGSQEAQRFIGGAPATMADSFSRLLRGGGSWALYGYGMFHLRRAGEAELAGVCGVFHSWRGFGQGLDDAAEAGWAIRADLWGQGLATEAMAAILDWFDAAHGRETRCMIVDGHAVSERIAGRLGYAPYGSHHEEDGTLLNLFCRPPPEIGGRAPGSPTTIL